MPMLLPIIAVVCGLQTSQPKPPPDRSGEPVLKQIIETMSGFGGLEISINVASRSSRSEPFQPEQNVMLSMAKGGRFRVTTSGSWGDGSRFICDGRTLLIDRLDESGSITLKKAPENLAAADEGLTGQVDPIVYLVSGVKSIEKFVAKDGFIKDVDMPGPERALQYWSSAKGTVSLYYLESDRLKLVRRITFDNRPWQEQQAKQFPDWWEMPDDPLTVQSITYLSTKGKLPESLFDTSPPRGLKVVDDRPKKSGRT